MLGYQNGVESTRDLSAFPIKQRSKSMATTTSKVIKSSLNTTTQNETFVPINKGLISASSEVKHTQFPIRALASNPISVPRIQPNIASSNSINNPINGSKSNVQHKSSIGEISLEKNVLEKRMMELSPLNTSFFKVIYSNRLTHSFGKKRKRKIKQKKKALVKNAFLAVNYSPISIGKLKGKNIGQNNLKGVHQTQGLGLKAGVIFKNNWLFEMGFQRTNFQLQQNSSISLTHYINNAQVVENGREQTFTFELPAIIEPITGSANIFTPLADFNNGTTFSLQSNIQQQLIFNNLFTQIGYQIPINTRWQVLPKVGIGVSWGTKGIVQLDGFALDNAQQNIQWASISNTNRTSFNIVEGLFSTQLAYRYSRKLYFTATPQFRFGLSPFFNNNGQQQVYHRFGQLNVGIRIHLL